LEKKALNSTGSLLKKWVALKGLIKKFQSFLGKNLWLGTLEIAPKEIGIWLILGRKEVPFRPPTLKNPENRTLPGICLKALTTYGNIGVKVWIFKGEVLQKGIQPEPKEQPRQRRPRRRGGE